MVHFIAKFSGIMFLCLLFNPTNAVFTQRLFDRKFKIQSVVSGNFTCKPGQVTVECSYRGSCRDDGKSCICNDGYTSSPNNDQECDYKQKDTLTAFLLELFLGPLGGGYFYLGLIPHAVGQLCLTVIGLIPVCFIFCLGVLTKNEGCVIVSAYCYMCLWLVAVIGWWIASIVIIAQAAILDGNNMPFPHL